MKTRLWGTPLLAAAALCAASCQNQNNYLKPVVSGSGTWQKTVRLVVLDADFNIRSPKKLFRDDGLYDGNLSIHTQEIGHLFTADSTNTSGKASEGLLTEGTRPDGNRCVLVYGLSTGDRTLDRARREMLCATAIIRMGMREGLEQYFRKVGVKVQFKMMTDRGLAKLVEAYALDKMHFPLERIKDLETRQMSQLLINQGIGTTGRAPVGTRGRMLRR
jgi:hypothetical protein